MGTSFSPGNVFAVFSFNQTKFVSILSVLSSITPAPDHSVWLCAFSVFWFYLALTSFWLLTCPIWPPDDHSPLPQQHRNSQHLFPRIDEETAFSPISVATVIKGKSRWWRGGYYFITPYAFDILVTGSIWRFPYVNHCVGPKPRMVSNILTNITSESHLLIGKGECCLLSFQRGLFCKAVFTPRLLILDKMF